MRAGSAKPTWATQQNSSMILFVTRVLLPLCLMAITTSAFSFDPRTGKGRLCRFIDTAPAETPERIVCVCIIIYVEWTRNAAGECEGEFTLCPAAAAAAQCKMDKRLQCFLAELNKEVIFTCVRDGKTNNTMPLCK